MFTYFGSGVNHNNLDGASKKNTRRKIKGGKNTKQKGRWVKAEGGKESLAKGEGDEMASENIGGEIQAEGSQNIRTGGILCIIERCTRLRKKGDIRYACGLMVRQGAG